MNMGDLLARRRYTLIKHRRSWWPIRLESGSWAWLTRVVKIDRMLEIRNDYVFYETCCGSRILTRDEYLAEQLRGDEQW